MKTTKPIFCEGYGCPHTTAWFVTGLSYRISYYYCAAASLLLIQQSNEYRLMVTSSSIFPFSPFHLLLTLASTLREIQQLLSLMSLLSRLSQFEISQNNLSTQAIEAVHSHEILIEQHHLQCDTGFLRLQPCQTTTHADS